MRIYLNKKYLILIVGLIIALISLFINIDSLGKSPTARPGYYRVVKVVDGDTIEVKINDKIAKVRMIGINTPEIIDPRRPVECYGKEASAKLKSLLEKQEVRLEADASQDLQDRYGRLLRYVFDAQGRNINLLMIQEGYAYEYTYERPYFYQAEFKAAQKEAMREGRGLWASNTCNGKKNRKR